MTPLESFIVQPERRATALGSPPNGLMGQFGHNLGWIISFRDLATSLIRGTEASLREGSTLAMFTEPAVVKNKKYT